MRDCDKVELIKQFYPGFDKSLFAKSKRPEYYAITLTKDAKLLIGEDRKKKQKTFYMSVRTTKAFRDEIRSELKKEGFPTLQSGIMAVLHDWIEKRKAAAGTATNQDVNG